MNPQVIVSYTFNKKCDYTILKVHRESVADLLVQTGLPMRSEPCYY